ncbi:MAG: helix-turn-helix domain-containing protein [Candidatus Gastranaerophilales bacterium]|nr:helix-turn-helix domain-containing protein [Candidatus Gastranaerophilales bacterium]
MNYSEKEIMKNFGKKVKKYRKLLNLTQQQLADKCGCSAQTISGTETGYSFPSSDILFKLSFSLNVPLAYLFNFDDRQLDNEEFYFIIKNSVNKLDKKDKDLLIKILKCIAEQQ